MKIAVVGSMNMDMIVHTDRIPLKGETIKGDGLEYQPGGKGANQAAAMAKLGADVTMFGCVGDDGAGRRLVENLRECRVCAESVEKRKGVPTGQAIITAGGGDNTIVVIEGANRYVDVDYVNRNREKILEADLIVLQNEIPEETVAHTIHMCSDAGKIILWNPAPARELDPELIEKVSYITPNEHEACRIWHIDKTQIDSLIESCPGKLLVTRGEKGVSVCVPGKGLQTIPAMKVEVKDTTGAGDTLNGAFCAGLAGGMNELEALKFANAAAGLSVQKYGAQAGMPSLEQVQAVLAEL